MKMVKVYLNLSIFAVFLKNRNIISKIRRSKVTDYAALSTSNINYPHVVFLKRRGYCYGLRPSVHPYVILSPPKPLDEIQQLLVCELLTRMGRATALIFWPHPWGPGRGQKVKYH